MTMYLNNFDERRKYIMIKAKEIVLGSVCFLGIVFMSQTQAKAAIINENEPNELKTTANEMSVGDTFVGEIGSYYNYYNKGSEEDSDYIKIYLDGEKEYLFTINNWFDFFDDTTLIIDVISPRGDEVANSFNLIHDQYENNDYCYIDTDESGYYYIHLYNYIDISTKSSHYYEFSISETDNSSYDYNLNGLYEDEDGDWYYYQDGDVDWEYTGLYKEFGSWWYIRNGQINFQPQLFVNTTAHGGM